MSNLTEAIDELRDNDSQWEAYDAESHCVVLAPPGSGKTKLLTTKLASSLVSNRFRPPRGALCITMTNEAALELRRRLRTLGLGSIPNLFIGTVHSFALACIVRPFAAAAHRPGLAKSRLASVAELDSCFRVAFDRSDFRPDERASIFATTARARQRLDLSGDLRLGGPRIAVFARDLQKELERRDLYDFQDLVRHAVDLVEDNEWVRRVLSAAYPLVFVDEYQDLAPGLDRIVRAITLESEYDSTLFAVGDPDQAIYAFSGAHPQLLLDLAAEPSVHSVSLDRNYRSGQHLIDIASRLREGGTISGQRAGGEITLEAVPGAEANLAGAAVAAVSAAIKEGVPPDQIALLASWGGDRDRCVQTLRNWRIPVFARSDDDWRTTPVTSLLESMAAWAASDERSSSLLSNVIESLDAVMRGGVDHRERRESIAILLDASGDDRAWDFVESMVETVLHKLLAGSVTEDRVELEKMVASLDDSSASLRELGARARAPGHVLASTIHASKGLEFDRVVIVGADSAALYGFNPSDEEVAESRRKFYVSITRARDQVRILYSTHRTSKRGKPYDVGPSPFVAELGI